MSYQPYTSPISNINKIQDSANSKGGWYLKVCFYYSTYIPPKNATIIGDLNATKTDYTDSIRNRI